MHSSVKDHPSVSSVTSPVAPSVSKLSSTTLIGKSPRTIFKLDQLWALASRIYRSKNGMIDIQQPEFSRFSHPVPAFLRTG
ncbi:hypothetical protein FF1_010488 [Malus domestica]